MKRLGDAELEIMLTVWAAREPVTSGYVSGALKGRRDWALPAVEHSEKLRNYLGMKPGYHAFACLVIGYPDVKYYRSVPRKPADIVWR